MIPQWADANNWATLKLTTNQLIDLVNSMTNAMVPIGSILPWYGNPVDPLIWDDDGIGVVGSAYERFAICVGNGLTGSLYTDYVGNVQSVAPDLGGRFLKDVGYGQIPGNTGGVDTVLLTARQSGLRNHQHNTRIASSGGGAENLAVGNSGYLGRTPSEGTINASGGTGLNGDQPALDAHTNMPPFMAVYHIIRYK